MKTVAVLLLFLGFVPPPREQLVAQPVFSEHRVVQRPTPVALEPTGKVADLIDKLSEPSSEARLAAAEQLLEMGPVIEPQLRWSLQHEEAATNFPFAVIPGTAGSFKLSADALLPRYRWNELDVLMSHLEERRRLKGSIITLHYTNAPVAEVLNDLSSQADTDISFGSWYGLVPLDWIKTNRITLDVDRGTYWETLGLLQDRIGLGAGSMNGRNKLLFQPWSKDLAHQPSMSGRPAVAVPKPVVCGPFQITPVAVELRRRIEFGSPTNSATVKVTMFAQAEAKLGDLGMRALLSVNRCVDERGRSLILEGERKFPSADSNTGGSWTLPAEVAEPRSGHRIKSLDGELSVATGPPQRYLAITNLMQAQGQSREFDGLKLTVERVGKEGQHCEIEISLSAPSGSPYALTFSGPEYPNVAVWDKELRSIERMRDLHMAPEGIEHRDGREVGKWSLTCNRLPVVLLWLTPPETRWITVPFQLRDLPVP